MNFKKKDILGIAELSPKEIAAIIDTAFSMKEILERPIKKVPTLTGVTIANLFFEPSTRTLNSFQLAERRMSADIVSISSSNSSVLKGETLLDTARNIQAMKVDMVVLRHSMPGASHFLSKKLDASVINAGDGAHEHPTQALLDIMSIKEKFNKIDGLNALIVGDIAHSRVARSLILALKKSNANVSVCAPPTLLPYKMDGWDVNTYYNLDDAIKEQDLIYVLRIQLERQSKGLFPGIREYIKLYGINPERLKRAKKDVVIMHPGPINRGIELSSKVADGHHSIILNQVTNGVAVRMAVLYLLSRKVKKEKG